MPRKAKWEFDAEVTDVFVDMLARSIPQIDVMRSMVAEVALSFGELKRSVVDLGASRGDAGSFLLRHLRDDERLDLVEVSRPMVKVCRTRFKDDPRVHVHEFDLREGYPPGVEDKTASMLVLALQFMPIEHRLRILRDVWRTTVSGGCIVLVEKVLGSTAESNDMLVRMYHELKRRNGYSQEEIDRKAQSLEGVLVPVTARWNEDLLASAGFGSVECFWRCLNFAAWVGVK